MKLSWVQIPAAPFSSGPASFGQGSVAEHDVKSARPMDREGGEEEEEEEKSAHIVSAQRGPVPTRHYGLQNFSPNAQLCC